MFADPFFAEVVVGIYAVLEETELELMLLLATSSRGQTRLEQLLRTRQAAGVMLMSMHGDDPLARLAEQSVVPVVFGGRPLSFEPRYYVDADNRGGARLATEHLIASGRTQIATITGRMDEGAGSRAVQGLPGGPRRRRAGRPAEWRHADFSRGRRQPPRCASCSSEHPDLDAVFVASDQMAVGALQVLKEAGRSVPGDVAIVGFNDIAGARHIDPPLTTVDQPIQSLGREMARMLLALISGRPHRPADPPDPPAARESPDGIADRRLEIATRR